MRDLTAWLLLAVAGPLASCLKPSDDTERPRPAEQTARGPKAGDTAPVAAGAPDLTGARPGGDAELAAAPAPRLDGDVDLESGDADIIPASAVGTLPENWQGTGVLADRRDRVPRRAPEWAKVAAEVVSRDGQRYLAATGRAGKIRDPFMSRTTAESRARAALAQWLGAGRVNNSVVSDVWRDPKTGETFVRAEVPVAPDWQPAKAL